MPATTPEPSPSFSPHNTGARPAHSRWRSAAATALVLWRRDLLRFLRQPSRIVGALGQPLLFWAIIGSGFAPSFQVAGSRQSYQAFFFAGVVAMIALFASIFATVSLIEDRAHGFLLAVLTAPGPRWALMLGKTLGGASVALLQIGLFLLLLPLAGFVSTNVSWLALGFALTALCVGLNALSFAVAWRIDSVQAYHAVQMTLLVPLWVVSGAMFPLPAHGPMAVLGHCNPMAYGVSAVRHALAGGRADAALVHMEPAAATLGLAVFLAVALVLGAASVRRVR